MSVPLRGTAARPAGASASSPRLVDAGSSLEREALAGDVANPRLAPLLAELTPDHFHDETSRALRAHLVDDAPLDAAALALLAELDARAATNAIDENVGTELLLTLRERGLQEELQHAAFERTTQIQREILRLREALGDLRRRTPVAD
jgi:hypothetical protein